MVTGHPLLSQVDSEQPEMNLLSAEDVMSRDPLCVSSPAAVHGLVRLLHACRHNGFPIVQSAKDRRFLGLVTRAQLLVAIAQALDGAAAGETADGGVDGEDVVDDLVRLGVAGIRRPVPLEATVAFADKSAVHPAAVPASSPIRHVLALFLRGGARHVVVVSPEGLVVGIICRQDVTTPILKGLLDAKLQRLPARASTAGRVAPVTAERPEALVEAAKEGEERSSGRDAALAPAPPGEGTAPTGSKGPPP